jgi:NAD(P)-dependent dehydrogenase (short-subunit alcohol dehydrogenase family)
MSKLSGKIAVITGGSSGIGLAAANRFVEEGAYVYITGRRQTELDKAKAVIGNNVTVVQGDVGNLADLDRLYATVEKEKGLLHILVANAGMVEMAPLEASTPEHFDRVFNVNARGTWFSAQKALRLMKNGGSIVLVGSGAHLKGFPAMGVYAATKAAMRSYARTWATELKGRNIRVNTLSPGAVDTPILDGMLATKAEVDGMKQAYAQMTPLGRIGHSEEMANAILFLASDESSFSTGIDLVADGGLTQL